MSEEEESDREEDQASGWGPEVVDVAGCCLLEAAAGAIGMLLLLALPYSLLF